MAAAATAITNIYEPGIASEYFVEQSTSRSALVQSGIMGSTPEIAAAVLEGGRTITMPFWDDLVNSDAVASSLATDTDTAITPTGATTDYDVAVKMYRTKAWQHAPIVRHAAGADPLRLFIDRYVNWWLREKQRLLLKTLYGIFQDSGIATALSNDIAGEVATTDASKLISSAAIEDTRFLLGDAYSKFTAMIVHSVVLKRMRSLGLIDTVPEQNQQLLQPGDFYQGLRVLCDDDLTKVAGSTSGYKYYTYLFGQGAIAYQDIPTELFAAAPDSPAFEIYREPTKGTGAGLTWVLTRQYFVLHPRGIKIDSATVQSGATGPSDAQLAADNWTQVWLTKNIRIARLITNG